MFRHFEDVQQWCIVISLRNFALWSSYYSVFFCWFVHSFAVMAALKIFMIVHKLQISKFRYKFRVSKFFHGLIVNLCEEGCHFFFRFWYSFSDFKFLIIGKL